MASPFDLYGYNPANPFSGDSEDKTTADVLRELQYQESPFGKVKSFLDSYTREPELEGGGATVFGKMLGAVGLDASGDRANTTWGQSLSNTATMFNPFDMAIEGAKSANRWAGATMFPEKLETADMLAPFGGAAIAAPFSPTGAVGMLGGKLSKNPAHTAAIKRAEDMAAQGVPREDIWKETMAFQAPDGHWKVEFDDSKAHFTQPQQEKFVFNDQPIEGSAAFVFRHPEAWQAYPDAAKTQTSIQKTEPGAWGGSYDGSRIEGQAHTTGDARELMLHEGQHAIQDIEGFSPGGSPGMVGDWLDAALRPINRELVKMSKSGQYGSDAYKALAAKRDELINQSWDLNNPEKAMESYRRLGGEAEARAVQVRRDLTPEERAARPFWLDYDVPEGQQIIPPAGVRLSSAEGSGPFRPRGADAPSGANPPDSLPMDEASRLARAREMGFDTDQTWYHGSKDDVSAFDLRKAGKSDPGLVGRAAYLTPSPGQASDFAMNPFYGKGDSPNVMPLHTRMKNPAVVVDGVLPDGRSLTEAHPNGITKESAKAIHDQLAKQGYDGVIFKTGDGEYTQAAVFDPKNIRSKFAAFDPAKSNSANLLAADQAKGSLPGTILQAAEREGPFQLPMDEASRLARAREMGFDTENPLYHGTDAKNIKAFQPRNQSGGVRATYVTPDRDFASMFTETGNVMDLLVKREGFADLGNPEHLARIAELYSKATGLSAEEALAQVKQSVSDGRMDWANRYATGAVKDAGFKGVDLRDSYGPSTAVFDPSHIRSVNAAFDPAKSSSANLLAADQAKGSLPGVIVQAAEREGPFDLPMDDASRMARAKEMGFDTDQTWWHGSPDARGIHENGFQTLKERMNGDDPNRVFFFAKDKRVADTYADDRRAFDYQNAEPETIAAHLKGGKQHVIDWGGRPFRGRVKNGDGYDIHQLIDKAREEGYDSVRIDNVIDDYNAKGKPSSIVAVFDPKNIRSPKAAFDPAKSDSRNILAADQAKASLPGTIVQASEREGPFVKAPDVAKDWNTGLTLYHGTGTPFERFDMKKANDKEGRKRGLGLGQGKVYLHASPEVGSKWAEEAPRRGKGDTPLVMPLHVRGKFMDESDYHAEFKRQSGGFDIWDSSLDQKTRDKIVKKTDEAVRAQGYAGIQQVWRDKDGNIKEVGQVAVFDPNDIRSKFDSGEGTEGPFKKR